MAALELEIYLHSVRGRSGSMRWTTGMYFAVGCVSAATALLQPLAPQTFRRLRGAGAGTGGALRMCGPGVAPYSTDELASVLSVAKEAARAAGAVMQANIGAAVTKTKCSNKDLLTEIDPLCQRVISDKVAANFPAHKFLGEESVAAGDEASSEALADLIKADWQWVVDPIDGTTNFVQGQPMSVISVGVAHKGNLVVGVIMDPLPRRAVLGIGGRWGLLQRPEDLDWCRAHARGSGHSGGKPAQYAIDQAFPSRSQRAHAGMPHHSHARLCSPPSGMDCMRTTERLLRARSEFMGHGCRRSHPAGGWRAYL